MNCKRGKEVSFWRTLIMHPNKYEELRTSFEARYQCPRYGDAVEITVPAGTTEADEIKVPLGSFFHCEMLNIEWEPDANGACPLLVSIEGIAQNTVYTANPIRASLISSPGKRAEGTRFGGLPFQAMIPAEDGLRFKVTNEDTKDRTISISAWGKRWVHLSSEEISQFSGRN